MDPDGAGWVVLSEPGLSSPSPPPSPRPPGPPPSSPTKMSKTDKVVNKIASVLSGAGSVKRGAAVPPSTKDQTSTTHQAAPPAVQAAAPSLPPVIVPRDHAEAKDTCEVETPVRSNLIQETDPNVPPDNCTVAPPSKDDTVVLSLDQPPSVVPAPQTTRSDTSTTITPSRMSAKSDLAATDAGPPVVGGASRTALGDVIVPAEMQNGMTMLKVSAKKIQQKVFKLDPDKGTIEWGSRKGAFGQSNPRRPGRG